MLIFLYVQFLINVYVNIVCFRNRLESNAEHWGALLLSLRELIEWVIRKDTELSGLGPLSGDLPLLQKQQVNKSIFYHICNELKMRLFILISCCIYCHCNP
jgi:hypothetical protein